MFPQSFPGGPLDERSLIYDALAAEEADETPADDGDGADDPERPAAAERIRDPERRGDPEPESASEAPSSFACLGCGAVTTAPGPPESCPECHRTAGDRRGGALFQSLD